MIQTEEKVYKNNDIKKEDFSFEILKELKDKIFKINNEFTFEILKEQKEKEEIKDLNKNKYNNKPLEISNNLKIELLKNNNQLKSENNILEIYQNKDFTFKILNKEENKKKESNLNIINTFSFLIENTSILHKSLNSKSRNSKLLDNKEISFKQDSSSHNSQDSNRLNQIFFSEEKTLLSSQIISFSIIDKENNEKITIEKPYNIKNKYDFTFIKPENILSNNINILASYKKKDKTPFELIKPLITDIKENLSISTLSINIEGKDLTISRDESKEITKDISKDNTQISKDIIPKNYEDDEMRRNSIFKKLKQLKEFNEFIPSFNNKELYEENEIDKTISKDKSIDLMNKSDNKQDNSYLGYQLDEPVQHPLNENIGNNTTFDMKDDNSPSFHPNLNNDLLLSKKFYKLILGDNKNNNNQLFDDSPIERETFMPNYNLNKNTITNYSFELINKEYKNENDISVNLLKINEDEYQLSDSIFTHNFLKKEKDKKVYFTYNKSKGRNLLLKSILPLRIIQVIKGNIKKNVFDKLKRIIPLIIKNKKMIKIINNYSNKLKKIYVNKWKMRCLIMKIKKEIIHNHHKDNETNIKYQRRTRFMFEGKKIFGKKNEENDKETNKKENIIKKNDEKDLNEKKEKLNKSEENNKVKSNNKNEKEYKEEIDKVEDNEREIYIQTKEIKIIKIPKLSLFEKFKLRNKMRKWKENIKEKLIIINENNLFIPSNKKEDYDILIEKNLENKKKKVKNLKEQKLKKSLKALSSLSINKFEISLITNLPINKSFNTMGIYHNQIQIDSTPIQERNIHISFLPPISEKIIDEGLSEEKEICLNNSFKAITPENTIKNKLSVEMKEEGIQSSPLFDVNVHSSNNQNIIQTLPSLDEYCESKNNYNSYNISNINNKEMLKSEEIDKKNYTFNAKKKNLFIKSPQVQISYLPNSAKFSNTSQKESFKSQKNEFTDVYEMNIPSNEQNDDFIIDSVDSQSFKDKSNLLSISNNEDLKNKKTESLKIRVLRNHSYSTSRDLNLDNSLNNSSEKKRNNENLFNNDNTEKIEIIDSFEDFESLNNEDIKNDNLFNSKQKESYNKKSVFHKFYSKLKKDNEKKNKLIKILNCSNELNNNKILKEYFKKWKKKSNSLIPSLISIKSLNIKRKKNLSSPNCSSLFSNIKTKSLLKKNKNKFGVKKEEKSLRKLKRCKSDNLEILFKEKLNSLYSNIKKEEAKKNCNKIFNEYIKIQIPKITSLLKLYKKIPKAVNLIKLNKIKNSFKDFVKNSFSDKYKKIYNKVEDEG